MKVCFLGSSSLHSVAKAWGEDPADLQATFLAAPGGQLGDALGISNGRLRATGQLRETLLELTGVAEAPVDEFDAFAVVGLRFGLTPCARIFSTQRTWQSNGSYDAGADEPILSSRPLMLAAAQEQLRQSIAVSLAGRLRAVTSAPVLIVALPFMSDRVLVADSEPTEVWRDLHAHNRGTEIRSLYEEACRTLEGDFQIVRQPAETISNEILTLARYDCWEPGKSLDHFHLSHMNVQYGRLTMRELLDRLAG